MEKVDFPHVLKEDIVPWDLVDKHATAVIVTENNRIAAEVAYELLDHSDRIYNLV